MTRSAGVMRPSTSTFETEGTDRFPIGACDDAPAQAVCERRRWKLRYWTLGSVKCARWSSMVTALGDFEIRRWCPHESRTGAGDEDGREHCYDVWGRVTDRCPCALRERGTTGRLLGPTVKGCRWIACDGQRVEHI